MVERAEAHRRDFTARAADHDRDASFPFENVEDMARSGILGACVPAELGGLGVESIVDIAAGMNRLGRGDGATAIAANMHISLTWELARDWRAAGGSSGAPEELTDLLRGMGAGQVIGYAALTETATDILHPLTTATPADGGWRLSGRKAFGTMSAASQVAGVTFRFTDPAGAWRTGFALVPTDAPGYRLHDDWDALGMRASGSFDTTFEEVFVLTDSVVDIGPWGDWSPSLGAAVLAVNLGLAAAMLGIAESAHEQVVETVKTRRKQPGDRPLSERAGVQHLVAESEIDLAVSRSLVARVSAAATEFLARYAPGSEPMGEFHPLHKEFQAAKHIVTRNAIRVADRALTLSGGSGYLNRSPLARLYRDVRAGPFMQPFSPNEVHEYIGRVALGLDPNPMQSAQG